MCMSASENSPIKREVAGREIRSRSMGMPISLLGLIHRHCSYDYRPTALDLRDGCQFRATSLII